MKIIKEIGRSPHVDWIIIIFSAIFLVIALAITGIYLYNAVNRGNAESAVNMVNSSRILDQKKIAEVLERFYVKEQASEKVRDGYTGPSDPSI